MRVFVTTALLCGSMIAAAGPAKAWGPEGHALIADLAAGHLTPAAAAEVNRLLAGEGSAKLDDISSWADAYRVSHPETTQWHFVDIPLDTATYDEARDCHYGDKDTHVAESSCIVAKIADFTRLLADKTQSDATRLTALKYVVHFVGDIHQPLHAEDNNHDRGGNQVKLTYNHLNTNLHALWDGGIIEKHYNWSLGPNYSFDHGAVAEAAATIDSEVTATERSAWAPPGLVPMIAERATGWVMESHGLARDVYGNLPKDQSGDWEEAYQAYAWPVIETQIEKGGARLAELLNEALAPH